MKTFRLPRTLRLLAVVALAPLSGGCSDQGPDDELLRHVETARSRWNSARLDRYAYGLLRICECTPELAGPVSVSVQGADAIAWTYADGSVVPPAIRPSFPSVDGLFDMIEQAIRQGAWEVSAMYDEQTGVPIEFRLDYEQFVFDEEAYYRVVAMPQAPSG